MEPLGVLLMIFWAAMVYICIDPVAGVRLGAWLRNETKDKDK
jgi:hypothetical protein